MKEIQDMIQDLRYVARYPGNYSVSYICRKAADLMERMMQEQTVQGEWLAPDDLLLKTLLQKHKERNGEEELEVIVLIRGATVATTAIFDGAVFYDGFDPVPVEWWMPLPEPPKKSEGWRSAMMRTFLGGK